MTGRAEISGRLSVVLGLPKAEAAAAIGISLRRFHDLVADGTLPRPRLIGGCLVWDVEELWVAFKACPHDREEPPQPQGVEIGEGWDDLHR